MDRITGRRTTDDDFIDCGDRRPRLGFPKTMPFFGLGDDADSCARRGALVEIGLVSLTS